MDAAGAADLSHGLHDGVQEGLIYAGQAGATRWPSGRRSPNTLWTRLIGMHLGSRAEFSTFRRTLTAALREPLALDHEDDPKLNDWMAAHLRVVTWVTPDADRLHDIEAHVLSGLDPPLNLRGMPTSLVRHTLSQLRRARD